jgi:hypothetical protein
LGNLTLLVLRFGNVLEIRFEIVVDLGEAVDLFFSLLQFQLILAVFLGQTGIL